MTWLKWLMRITVTYLVLGVITGIAFFALADFDVDWNLGNLKLFAYIILSWPLWVWFMVVMWLSSRG